ncbi:MAG: hypothetical protein M1820_008596 [Bogoriella megaspora]|nr:MAG: hypothetical protein M1820_008596 [Bogoriella megaspora]
MPGSLTLLDYLTKANPAIKWQSAQREQLDKKKSKKSKTRSSTRNDKYPVLQESAIRRWEDFDFKTIRNLFERSETGLFATLDKRYDLQDFSDCHSAFHEISDEDSLEALLIKHTQSTVLEALEKTTTSLLRQEVEMVRGGQAQFFHKTNKIRPLKPDWAGRCTVRGVNSILPGETKRSDVFRSQSFLENVNTNGEDTWLWPVRQLAAYCVFAHMRYGYIITDEELIVARVGTKDKPNTHASLKELRDSVFDHPTLEWFAIPRLHHDKKSEMTVNLALFALHILAANNGLLDWGEYPSLKKEEVLRPEQQPQLAQDSTSSFSTSGSQNIPDVEPDATSRNASQDQQVGDPNRGSSNKRLQNLKRQLPHGDEVLGISAGRSRRKQSGELDQSFTSTVTDTEDGPAWSHQGTPHGSFVGNMPGMTTRSMKRKGQDDSFGPRKSQRNDSLYDVTPDAPARTMFG